MRQTKRQRDRLHILNSSVTIPTFPTSVSCHSGLMTTSILSLPSVTSITQGPDVVIRRWAPYHPSTLLCVCMYLCVPDWVCDPLLWNKCECVQIPDCVSTVWLARLPEKSLSDCRSIWQAPILRKAYGLGRGNKYTVVNLSCLHQDSKCFDLNAAMNTNETVICPNSTLPSGWTCVVLIWNVWCWEH